MKRNLAIWTALLTGAVLLVLSAAIAPAPVLAQDPTQQPTLQATAEATKMAATAEPTSGMTAGHSGMGGMDSVAVNPPALETGDSLAFLWFAHTAADMGAVDIYVQEYGDTPIVENISFGQVSPMVRVTNEARTFVARTAGSGIPGEELATLQWDISTGTSWLISLVGREANMSVTLEPLSLLRNETGGSARVRVVNYIPEAGSVTIASDAGDDFGQGLGWIGVKDLELQPNTYTLSATNDAGELIAPQAFTFDADTANMVLLVGSPEGANVPQFITLSAPQDTTRIRFINKRAEAVDVYMIPGAEQVAAGVQSGETTDYYLIPSRAVTFTAYAPGTGPTGTQLASISEQLYAGNDVTITIQPDGTMVVSESVFTPDMMAQPD